MRLWKILLALLLVLTGSGPSALASIPLAPKNPCTGQFRGVVSGHRYYSPTMGRWINRDPLEERGGIHLLAFVLNHPINRVDTNGREGDEISTLGAGLISAGMDALADIGKDAAFGALKGAISDGWVSSLHNSSWSTIAGDAWNGALKGGITGAFGYFSENGLSGISSGLSITANAFVSGALNGAKNGSFSQNDFVMGVMLGTSGADDDKILDISCDLAGTVGVDAAESIDGLAETISDGKK